MDPNDRYSSHLGFINHLSNQEKSGRKASQTHFTTGVRGSLHTNQFLARLESLGVKNLSNQLYNGSMRLPVHKPVSGKIGVTWCKKQKHARSHTKQNGSKNDSWSLSYLGYLYPGTTPVMIKLDHNRSCPWV